MSAASSSDPKGAALLRRQGQSLLAVLHGAADERGREGEEWARAAGADSLDNALFWLQRQDPALLALLWTKEYPDLPLTRLPSLDPSHLLNRALGLYASRGSQSSPQLPGVSPPQSLAGESQLDT